MIEARKLSIFTKVHRTKRILKILEQDFYNIILKVNEKSKEILTFLGVTTLKVWVSSVWGFVSVDAEFFYKLLPSYSSSPTVLHKRWNSDHRKSHIGRGLIFKTSCSKTFLLGPRLQSPIQIFRSEEVFQHLRKPLLLQTFSRSECKLSDIQRRIDVIAW